MKQQRIWALFLIAVMAFSVTGCYTVLLRPGMTPTDALQNQDDPSAARLNDADAQFPQTDYQYEYLPYYWGNATPSSEYIFYYSTPWWSDSYDNYLEAEQSNKLPEPPRFGRRSTSATQASPAVSTGGASTAAPVLTKQAGSTHDNNQTDNTSVQRATEDRRETMRRHNPDGSKSDSGSKVKRKK